MPVPSSTSPSRPPPSSPPRRLSVATRLTKSFPASPWSAESKITTGIFRWPAIATGRRRAAASSGARAIALTPSVTNCSTIAICWPRSFSLSGPFQTRSTSSSAAASRAPASTVFQNTWVVPLGIIAIRGRAAAAGTAATATSRMAKRRSIGIPRTVEP